MEHDVAVAGKPAEQVGGVALPWALRCPGADLLGRRNRSRHPTTRRLGPLLEDLQLRTRTLRMSWPSPTQAFDVLTAPYWLDEYKLAALRPASQLIRPSTAPDI